MEGILLAMNPQNGRLGDDITALTDQFLYSEIVCAYKTEFSKKVLLI